MSEERKLILQMVAESKISPEEAEKLLQAIDESERAARSTAAEGVRSTSQSSESLPGLGQSIERAVNESLRGLDSMLRGLEGKLESKLQGHEHEGLRRRIEEKMRRVAERAAERAAEAEERAAQAAARAAERATEKAERIARRFEQGVSQATEQAQFVKMGVVIDKVTVERSEHLSISAQPDDSLVLENRVGDIRVEYHAGTEIEVDVRKTVWGQDEADAAERAAATDVQLTRRGSGVVVEVVRPSISAIGVVILKDTRLDFTIRAPHGTNLQVRNKVGDLRILAGDEVGKWDLETRVGDVDLQVGQGAGFRYNLATKVGDTTVSVPGRPVSVPGSGQVGDGSGQIVVTAKTGDIRLHY